MIKVLVIATALLASPLVAHEEGMLHDASGTAKPAIHGKMKAKKLKKAKTVAAKEHWVCPMHDGGESDHAGKCPKCGMDLVLEKK